MNTIFGRTITALTLLTAMNLCHIAHAADSAPTANAKAGELPHEVNCLPTKSYPANSACARLQRAWQVYRAELSLADLGELTATLRDVQAAPMERESATVSQAETALLSYLAIHGAEGIWHRWAKVVSNLTDEDRKVLAGKPWQTRLALARRDPYAALESLNREIKLAPDTPDTGLRLLLAGLIAHNLEVLFNAAAPVMEAVSKQKYDAFAAARKDDFFRSELCSDWTYYSGSHYKLIEKRFKSTKLSEAAAYLSMGLGSCGCEGHFDCYLSDGLSAGQTFLRKHPESTYAKEVLLRLENQIRESFLEREAQADFLSADNHYSPAAAADSLLRFESDLKNVDPAMLVPIKVLLGDLYVKLNQPANVRRVAEWLAQHAPTAPARQKLDNALAQMPRFELRLARPTSHGPNIIALQWEQRPGGGSGAVRLLRAEDPAFTGARLIGAVIPPGTFSAIDRSVEPNVCYWYRLVAEGDEAKVLTQAAFAQTRQGIPRLNGLVFDVATRSLYGTGWFSEREVTPFLIKLQPEHVPQVGRIFGSGYSRFSSPVQSPTWWIDRDAGIVVQAKDPAADIVVTDLWKSADDSRSASGIGITTDRKRILAVYPRGGATQIASASDGKSFYVWESDGYLSKRDAAGSSLELLFTSTYANEGRAADFRAIYLFVRRNGEVWLLGSKTIEGSGQRFVLRKFSKDAFVDVILPGQSASYFTGYEGPTGWLYDPDEDGVWTASYDGWPTLFGFDGKLKRKLELGRPEWSKFLGTSLARDPLSRDLYVASVSEVIRVAKDGKISMVWHAPKKADPDPSGSCPAVAAKWDALQRELDAPR